MKRARCLGAWLGLAIFVLAGCAEARPPLRVCLEAKSPPFSSAAAAVGPDHGIDHDVSARVAAALGRPLRVHWFEASRDDELPMGHEANALLTRSACDLIAGYPLTRDGLAPAPAAASPESRGASSASQPRALLPSRPYLSLPLTVVSATNSLTIDTLEDLVGLRVAVERGSLASAIASVHSAAALRERLLRVSFEGDAIFRSLENGAADAAFVERHRFELYRARAPATRLHDTGYRHPLGVNTGFVGRDPLLISALDDALRVLVANGRVAEIVEAHGLGYSAPMPPAILPRLTPRLLARPGQWP